MDPERGIDRPFQAKAALAARTNPLLFPFDDNDSVVKATSRAKAVRRGNTRQLATVLRWLFGQQAHRRSMRQIRLKEHGSDACDGNPQIQSAQHRARILLGFALPAPRRKLLRRAMFSLRKLNLSKKKFVSSLHQLASSCRDASNPAQTRRSDRGLFLVDDAAKPRTSSLCGKKGRWPHPAGIVLLSDYLFEAAPQAAGSEDPNDRARGQVEPHVSERRRCANVPSFFESSRELRFTVPKRMASATSSAVAVRPALYHDHNFGFP
jgi:hypothetical protein